MICCYATTVEAAPTSINVSTGLDTSGSVQTTGGANDANWIIGGQPARVVAPDNAGFYVEWPANNSSSAWVAKNPNEEYGNGLGTYSCVFDLTGVDLTRVSLTGTWAVDDQGSLSLNGNLIATQAWDGWRFFETQSFIVTNPSWFNQGPNTLTMTITQTDVCFEAVRLSGTVVTPEPATLSLLALGGLGLLLWRRRLGI